MIHHVAEHVLKAKLQDLPFSVLKNAVGNKDATKLSMPIAWMTKTLRPGHVAAAQPSKPPTLHQLPQPPTLHQLPQVCHVEYVIAFSVHGFLMSCCVRSVLHIFQP